MSVRDWIRKHYDDLELLKVSHDGYVPGCILSPRTYEILADAWSVLDETGTEPQWATRLAPAQVLTGSFEHETGGRGDLRLLGILTFSASRARKVTAGVEVAGVQVKRFARLSRLQLETGLRTLKRPGSETWKRIDGKTVALECYAATRLRLIFREEGRLLGKADVEKVVRPSVSAGGELSWLDAETLEVTGTGEVPFGIRGFRL
jgi:hypothetical protein